jgi:hypothetical protein
MMAWQVIPWDAINASFRETVELDGVPYTIWAKWNTAYEFWTIDILDLNEVVLVAGLKLVVGIELIRRFNDERLPPGNLVVVDVAGTTLRVARNDVGSNVQLMYREIGT